MTFVVTFVAFAGSYLFSFHDFNNEWHMKKGIKFRDSSVPNLILFSTFLTF